jgi:hypothetical protein
MAFKLRKRPVLDEEAGLGLFAGDKRKTSARQYCMTLIIGLGFTATGMLCLLAPALTTTSRTELFKLILVGGVLLLMGVLIGHASVIFFIRRIKTKQHDRS